MFFNTLVDLYCFSSLLDLCSVRDQARLRPIFRLFLASAWLRAIPSDPLGLTLSAQEFVVAFRYWLGIPLFHGPARCSCGVVLDGHGDHILGCGDGPLRIRWHDAICDLLWHALVQDHGGCKKEQRYACGAGLDCPGDVFHPDFSLVSQLTLTFLCVTLCRIPYFVYLLLPLGWLLGVAAGRGEADNDSCHEAAVRAAGGIFIPLVVETLGLWSPMVWVF